MRLHIQQASTATAAPPAFGTRLTVAVSNLAHMRAHAFGRRATRVRSGPTRSIRRVPRGLSRVSTKQCSCKEHYASRYAHCTLPVPAGASAVRYCAVLTQCTLRRTSETFAQRDPGQPIGFQQAQSTAHGGGSVLWRCRWRSCCGRPRTASSSCSARQRSGLSARCRTQHGTLQRCAAYRGVSCNAG